MFFQKKQPVDERVRNAQNQIYREIYHFIMVICCISIVVKFITQGVSTGLVSTELMILIGGGVYYTMRSAQLGVFSDEVEMHDAHSKLPYSKKTLLYGVLSGILIALFMGLNSATNYANSTEQAIHYFILVFFVSLFIYAPFFALFLYAGYYTTKKKSDKVNEKNLEDPDEG